MENNGLNKDYKHFYLLSQDNLISMIETKDDEIKKLKNTLKKEQALKNKIILYNNFHMQEITKLDKIIGTLKGLRD